MVYYTCLCEGEEKLFLMDVTFGGLLLDVSSYSPGIYQHTITSDSIVRLHSEKFTVVR